jgi:hypothetical protein
MNFPLVPSIIFFWEHGSSGRVLAYQVQSPDFKPQDHQKIKARYGGTQL